MAKRRSKASFSPRKRPTQARAQRTFKAILQAGARILERDGYEALTTNGVAETAGVAIASLYEYFPNKQSLVAEIVSHVLDEIIADLQASLALAEPSSLRAWIAAMFAAVHKRRGVVAAIVEEVPFLWQIPAVDRARTRLLQLGATAGGSSDVSVYLLTTMTGAAVLESVLRPPKGHSQDELIDALTAIVNRITSH